MAKRRPAPPVGRIVTGDCVRVMDRWRGMTVDAIVTSPPYPRIRREYGYWTEAAWLTWMRRVVRSCERLLKANGSMVFIIGPNSRKSGRLAPWPYQFVLDVWGMGLNLIQDVYWVKVCRIPTGRVRDGLLRDAVEWCVWIGPPDCYRDQQAVLWEYSDSMKRLIDLGRRGKLLDVRKQSPSSHSVNKATFGRDRGGASPMNVLATINAGREADGHPAAFPEALAAFWVKYICPPRGIVLDPCVGSGTTCAVAQRLGRRWIGIDRLAEYSRKARRRIRRQNTTRS
ncbi:MAG TPA: site-specific DNA-methyltransferase [Phycisphaerae bacterium]|nr:site-specific DNA-methyltransferase [Phycisphaerae bacterium]